MDYEKEYKKLRRKINKINKTMITEVLYEYLNHIENDEYMSISGELDPDNIKIKDLIESNYKKLRILIHFFHEN
tara:strand:- start:1083 stop:1304 length:222 start_codon:yes stop_codon:yes gene_type:complete